jgi:hypothetical protein
VTGDFPAPQSPNEPVWVGLGEFLDLDIAQLGSQRRE